MEARKNFRPLDSESKNFTIGHKATISIDQAFLSWQFTYFSLYSWLSKDFRPAASFMAEHKEFIVLGCYVAMATDAVRILIIGNKMRI